MLSNQLTFEEVVQAARQLRPEQKVALIKTLQAETPPVIGTRANLIAELEALRTVGAFQRVDSLRNQYPSPVLQRITDQELLAAIHEAATEYEVDIEDLDLHDD